MCTASQYRPLTQRLPDFVARLCAISAAALLLLSGGCRMLADGSNIEGVRLFRQGYYDAAVQRFNRAIVTDPNNADAYYNLAATLHRAGLDNRDEQALKQAESMYNYCLDRSPDHVDCHRALAVLLVDTGQRDAAFRLLENWARQSPQSADALVELARLHHEAGSLETATLQLQQALTVDEHNDRAWAALATINQTNGEYARAQQNFQRAYVIGRRPGVGYRLAALNSTLGTPSRGDLGPASSGTRFASPGRTPRY